MEEHSGYSIMFCVTLLMTCVKKVEYTSKAIEILHVSLTCMGYQLPLDI